MTEYGEISMKGVRSQVLKMPRDQRLPVLMETFNSVLSSFYEEIAADSDGEIEEVLGKLRIVLTLNKKRAVALGVYQTLLGTLATKIPQAQIQKLYSDHLEELVEERTRELREVQENLLKSQRLAAIGEAASMVGHDLRNPLQAITFVLYLMQRELESSPSKSLEEKVETLQEQVEYMNKVVSDLQDYARPLKPNLVETEVHELVKGTLSAITLPKNVDISIIADDDFPKLKVDPTFMKRVLNNLVTNALQAMPDGGRLTVRACTDSEAAFISLQDTGVGIPKENLSKLFQPLFTTKSKGQGLGLAVCKRLVEALKGDIMVESEIGKGTTFTVKIPLPSMAVLDETVFIGQLESQGSGTLAPSPG